MKKSNAIPVTRASRRALAAPASTDAAGRIAAQLREKLSALTPGTRLPSVRALTEGHGASPVTVQRALAQLQREGRVVSRPGDGTFVAPQATQSAPVDVSFQALALGSSMPASELAGTPFLAPSSELLPLGTGYMDLASQPIALLRAATIRAARREHVWSRLHHDGLEPLRAWFARDIGGEITARQVLIVPGGQSGLSAVLRALVPAGAPLLVESPTYFGVLAIARAAGIRALPVPTDREGVRPDALEQAVQSSGARALYLQPTYGNPTGAAMSDERRRAIIELARRHNIFLIEDDYARDLSIDGAPPAPLVRECPSHVVYIRSLTKTVAPGLRIAGVVALGPVFERLRSARAVDDMFVSGLMQETALELVNAPGFRRHVEQVRAVLRTRRDAAVEAIQSELPAGTLSQVPRGGFNLWLTLPLQLDDLEIAQACGRAGVHINAGRAFFPAEPLGPCLRLSYAAATPSELREGVKRVGRVIARALR